MRLLAFAEADLGVTGSGAERVLASHVAGLTARGHSVTLVSGAAGPPARGDGVEVLRVGWSLGTPWRAYRAANRARARGPFDAVLVYHPYPAWRALRAPSFAATPAAHVFLSPWADEYDERSPGRRGPLHRLGRALRRGIEASVVRSVHRVLPMSGFMAARARALHGIVPEAIRVVPGGVDRARFAPPRDRGAARAALALPASAPVLLTLRNLEPRMGVEALLDAMPRIREWQPEAVLVVAGAGPLRRDLEARAAALGLGESVRFVGFVQEADLPALYGAADLFVLPTAALEGFGLVTLEALACGTPVLGTRVGATPEILEPLDPGLLVGSSPEAIGAGVLGYLARGDRDDLGRRCRAHTASYDWGRVVDALERELSDLDAAREPRGRAARAPGA